MVVFINYWDMRPFCGGNTVSVQLRPVFFFRQISELKANIKGRQCSITTDQSYFINNSCPVELWLPILILIKWDHSSIYIYDECRNGWYCGKRCRIEWLLQFGVNKLAPINWEQSSTYKKPAFQRVFLVEYDADIIWTFTSQTASVPCWFSIVFLLYFSSVLTLILGRRLIWSVFLGLNG